MLELSQDICQLFNADRLTIYVLGEDKQSIVSKVKTGLNSFKDLRLPLSTRASPAMSPPPKKLVNIHDVHDEAELKRYSPRMAFLKGVDKRTGYRSRQMLVAPVVDRADRRPARCRATDQQQGRATLRGDRRGGRQNHRADAAVALAQRQKPLQPTRTKYDDLVASAIISAGELDLAQRRRGERACRWKR